MKETPVLSDKNIFPDEEVIFSHIGKTKVLWNSLFDEIQKDYPEIAEEWRYYNDGKSWLMKVTRKTKTIFWLSLYKKSFRTSFYFTARAEEAILNSKLSGELKQEFIEGKFYGKLKAITVFVKNKTSIKDIKELISIKLSVK